ncbi:MAG TPA: ABC-2 transporter permease [Treponemataceae bacterium]|nr:ABC-2 transporter permease [Treponemataceae bacterium]
MIKSKAVWPVLLKRELQAFYQSPVAWIVTGLFLVFSGFLFFPTFFLINRAELRNFFSLLPVLFSFFIPALTMRLLAEETRSGSIETLLTLPVSGRDIVASKFLAVFIFIVGMLVPTLVYVFSISLIGKPEMGPIIGGYIGALFLSASFSAIGLYASSVTKNQIIAFFIAFSIAIILTLSSQFAIFLPAILVGPVEFFGVTSHFESISRGILDSRDLVYFISLTVFFLALTARNLDDRRKS